MHVVNMRTSEMLRGNKMKHSKPDWTITQEYDHVSLWNSYQVTAITPRTVVPGRGEAVNTKSSGCLVSGNLSYEQKNSQIQS